MRFGFGVGVGLGDGVLDGAVIARVRPGDYAPLGGVTSFTRADPATVAIQTSAALVDAAVLANVLRDAHYIGGIRTILLESARRNGILQSENLNVTWTKTNVPTIVPGANTSAGVSLDLIGDDSAVLVKDFRQTVTIVGNGDKIVAVHVRQGTSTSSVIRMAGGPGRLLGVLTWVAGLPVVTMATGTYIGYEALTDGVFRLLFVAPGMLTTDTNTLILYPATNSGIIAGGVGTLYIGGIDVDDASVARTYIKTGAAAVTQAVDALTLAGTSAVAGAATLFYRYWDVATRAWVNLAAAYTPGDPITPAVDRAYADIVVLRGTLSTAAAAAILGY